MPLARETIPAGEPQLIEQFGNAILERKTPGERDAHQKTLGLAKAEFRVLPELPSELKVGLFSEPEKYPAWIRFSNASAQVDDQPDARGMAIKLLGVAGTKILVDERSEETHDFLLATHNVFLGANVKEFAIIAQKKAQGEQVLKEFLAANPRIGAIFAATFRKFKNLLGSVYHSQTPYLFGEGRAVKYSIKRRDDGIALQENESNLSSALAANLRDRDHVFDFMIQLQKDEDVTPIEDATVEWRESVSPFVKVAKITIPAQDFDSDERRKLTEVLSYTPWHCLPEHRPLGGINRARKEIYQRVSIARHQESGLPRVEPTVAEFESTP